MADAILYRRYLFGSGLRFGPVDRTPGPGGRATVCLPGRAAFEAGAGELRCR